MSTTHVFVRNDDEDDVPKLFYKQASSKILVNIDEEIIDSVGAPIPEVLTKDVHKVKPKDCLPYLQAVLFSCVLEDVIMQLRILDECNNELRIIKTMADLTNLRAKKYEITQEHASSDELGAIDVKNLGCLPYKLDKLANDRIYCTELMIATYLEMSLQRCYSPITNMNKDILNREVYRFSLLEEEAKNKMHRRELLKQLRLQRNHFKTVAYDTDIIIDQLKFQVEDATLNAETRGRYIENWQRARTEQNEKTISDQEAGPSDAIKYYRLRNEQEQRVHSEVELLVDICVTETLAKVESWMNKYDTDTEDMDLKIQIMKNKFQDEVSKRIEMEETYAEHGELMKHWVQYKEDREKARQYREKMTNSAITVQAWWRGLLVRLELGPFKPKKKKPQAAKGGKKK